MVKGLLFVYSFFLIYNKNFKYSSVCIKWLINSFSPLLSWSWTVAIKECCIIAEFLCSELLPNFMLFFFFFLCSILVDMMCFVHCWTTYMCYEATCIWAFHMPLLLLWTWVVPKSILPLSFLYLSSSWLHLFSHITLCASKCFLLLFGQLFPMWNSCYFFFFSHSISLKTILS